MRGQFIYRVYPHNPLVVPDLSGRLPQHKYPCPECNGSGVDEQFDRSSCEGCTFGGDTCVDCEVCENCEGLGEFGFGCWYGEDHGECSFCRAPEVFIACNMYEENQPVCLPCYLLDHRRQCGCDLWEKWEKMVLDFTLQST